MDPDSFEQREGLGDDAGTAAAAAEGDGGRDALPDVGAPDAAAAGSADADGAPADAPKTADGRDTRARGSGRMAYVDHLSAGPAAAAAARQPEAAPAAGWRPPPNVRASLLQLKQLQGGNTLASILLPTPTADGLALSGYDCCRGGPSGAFAAAQGAPAGSVAEFRFELVRAQHVGPTGFEGRGAPLRRVARVGILDRQHHRLLANVHEMPPAERRGRDGAAWAWRGDMGGAAVVRCEKQQPDPVRGARAVHPDRLVLLVELNTAYALTAEDAAALPPGGEAGAAGLVDEVTSCWAMINLGRCSDLTKEMEITVPLYAGSPYAPVLLSKVYEADRAAAAAAAGGSPLRALFSRPKQPALVFRAGPLPPGWAAHPLAAAPRTLIAGPDLACALAAWRLALAQALGGAARPQGGAAAAAGHAGRPRGGRGWAQAVLGDAALAGFLGVCRDGLLLGEGFMGLWTAACQELRAAKTGRCVPGTSDGNGGAGAAPAADDLVAAFRRCTLAVAPLLHCATLPPCHAGNFEQWTRRRRDVVNSYLFRPADKRGRWALFGGGGGGGGGVKAARHPVEALSVLSGSEFVHRPFDVSEVRLEVGGPGAPWLAL